MTPHTTTTPTVPPSVLPSMPTAPTAPSGASRLVATVVTLVVLAVGLVVVGLAPAERAEGAVPRTLGDSLVVDGRGTYHAIGLGQWGALGYAVERGWSLERILGHYYGGTTADTVAESDVTMRLSKLDGAQTAVVHDEGGAVLVGAAEPGAFRALVAREVADGLYDVWGRTDTAVCPSAAAALSRETGWTRVARSVAQPTFRSQTDDPTANDLGRLLGVCEPSGTVRYYRGRIRALNASDGSNRTINVVPMEMMLRSVVAWEMSPSWADLGGGRGAVALQAQAVAARSYVLAYAWYSYARSCDNICVAYRGAASRSAGPTGARTVHEDARANAAVAATAGQVRRRSSGEIALTMYSASTGGYTAQGTGLASFPVVEDEGDAYRAGLSGGNPWHSWTRSVPVATIESRWPAIGSLRTIQTSRNGHGDWGGRVLSVTLVGSASSVTLSGDTFPRAVGLPSNWFAVRDLPDPDDTTTTTTPGGTSPIATCGDRVAPPVTRTLGVRRAAALVPAPARVLADTRSADRVGAGCTLVVPARVRRGTTAVAVNVTAVAPSRAGRITVYACGTDRPDVTTVHAVPGRPVSGSSIVAISSERLLCVHTTTDTHLVVESWGRFSRRGTDRFTPMAPFRRLDTREGSPLSGATTVRIAGRDRVPSSARAVAVTVHALDSTRDVEVALYPCAAGRSGARVLTVGADETVANGVIAALDATGSLCLWTSAPADLMLDVTGWFGPDGRARYRAAPATELGDSATGDFGGRWASLEDRAVRMTGVGNVPTTGVVALAGSLTVSDAAVESYLTVHGCRTAAPSLSMVRNVPPADLSVTSAVVGVSRSGAWCLRPGTAMHVRIDVLGWFVAG